MIVEKLNDFTPNTTVLLMGDFNAPPNGKARKVFEKQGGFSDVFDGRFGGTHHGFTGRPVSDRIDWILYKGRLRPCRPTRKIIRERPGGIFPSDHFQVYSEFRWIPD
jgi:endonuclease/exonuclease/phosphatase (EEP) superfamily protein YafD